MGLASKDLCKESCNENSRISARKRKFRKESCKKSATFPQSNQLEAMYHGLSFILHIAMPPVACSDDESSAVIDDAVVDVSSMPHNLLKRAHDEVESPGGEMPPQTRVRTDGTGASSSHEAVDDELASVLDLKAGIEDMLVILNSKEMDAIIMKLELDAIIMLKELENRMRVGDHSFEAFHRQYTELAARYYRLAANGLLPISPKQ